MNRIENIKNIVKKSPFVEKKEDWLNIINFFEERGFNNKLVNFIEITSEPYKYSGGSFLFSLWASGLGGNFKLFNNDIEVEDKILEIFDFLLPYKSYVSFSTTKDKYNFLMSWPEDKTIDVLLINGNGSKTEDKTFDYKCSLLQVALPVLYDESIIILNDFSSPETKLSYNMLSERGYKNKQFGEYLIFYSDNNESN